MFTQMFRICTFCWISDHGAETLFCILNMCLIVTSNSIAKAFVTKGIREFPLLFVRNSLHYLHHVVVESLLSP